MTPSQMGFMSQFPPVMAEAWCGEYKPLKE
jgi:hypothetical protein